MNCSCLPTVSAAKRVEVRETAKITAIALLLTSIALLALGSLGLALGMTRRFMSMGVGLVPYLGGWFVLTVAVGTAALALPFFIVSNKF